MLNFESSEILLYSAKCMHCRYIYKYESDCSIRVFSVKGCLYYLLIICNLEITALLVLQQFSQQLLFKVHLQELHMSFAVHAILC